MAMHWGLFGGTTRELELLHVCTYGEYNITITMMTYYNGNIGACVHLCEYNITIIYNDDFL